MLKLTRRRQDYAWGYLMVAPTVIGVLILNIYPLLKSCYLSFTQSTGFGHAHFIGLANYVRMMHDPDVWQALVNTLIYTAVSVVIGVFLSLVVAVLLNQHIRGRGIYRTIYFLPVVSAPAAVAMVWRWLYNADAGLFNSLLQSVGLPAVHWLTDPHTALFAIIIVGIWSMVGYNMVLFLAGLQEIPHDYYEASEIDGAGFWAQFFHITLPMISPTMFFVMITRIISAFQMFDFIYMLIGEQNPALPHTQTLVYLFYKHAFLQNNRGYGAAIVVYLLGIIMLITAFQMWAQKKWVYYA